MGVDAKRIQVCVLRIVKFTFNICSKFVLKHPLISCLFLLLFVFYFFLPRAFFLLIYSSSLLLSTYVFIRFYRRRLQTGIKKADEGPPKVVRKDGKSVRRTHTRSSSSRNMEVKSREEAVSDDTTKSNEGTTMTKTAGEKIDSLLASACEKIGELKSDLKSKSKSDFAAGSKAETEISTSEDEEAKESRNKAVEWNEDDQKNLMDLGLSELERNKRLESLIARRRARKLYKAQTDKNLMSSINASNSFLVSPVTIARCNTFDVSNSSDLMIPGSAPSILLERNPFDLPYDPFEEKPNLMADSFQQEFMEAQQKEMLFSRHESFALGSFHPFSTTHKERAIAGQSGFKRLQDEGPSDRAVQVQPLQFEGGGGLAHSVSATDLVTVNSELKPQTEELEEAISSTIDIKGKTIENSEMESSIDEGSEAKCDSSSSSLPQNDQHPARGKNAANLTHITPPVFRFHEIPTPSSGPCPLPRATRTANEMNYLASPATIDRSTLENHLLYTNSGPWHTPNDSIASDMQVEVSEVGSPPLTGDGSASSNDGDSLTYDGDAEKEITSGSDEMWGGVSPRAQRVQDQHDLASSREVNELSNDLISRDVSVRQADPEGSVIQLQNSLEGTSLLDPSISFTQDDFQNLQESMNVSEKSEDEMNFNYNLDIHTPAYDALEDEKSVEVTRDFPETSTITGTPATTFDDTDTGDKKKSVQVTRDLPETSTISEVDQPASEMTSESSNNHRESEQLSSEQSVEEVAIAYDADVPDPTCDDLEVLTSVEVSVPKISSECSHDTKSKSLNSSEQAIDEVSVAETIDAPVQTTSDQTSIISEITRDLSAAADEINSGVNNHSDSKSLNSLEQAIDEVSVAETIDAPVQTYDDLGDHKSVEIASGLPETSTISEIARDLSATAGEINSGVNNHTESRSLDSLEKAIEEVSITDTIDAPVNAFDELGEHKPVEVQNDAPHSQAVADHAIPTIEEGQSVIENENKNQGKESSIPSQDVEEKQSMSEVDDSRISQNPNDSSTSGSTVEQVSSQQTSSTVQSPPTSSMQTGVSEPDMKENTQRDKLLDQKLPENSALTPAQNEQHEILTDSGDHPSIESVSQNTEETSDALEKTIDKAIEMFHTNTPLIDEEKAKEDTESIKSMQDEVEKPTSKEASVESIEHVEGASRDQSGYDSNIQQKKPEEQQGELENLTEHRNAASPSKDAVEGDHIGMSSTVGEEALLKNSTGTNDKVSDEISNKDQFGLISGKEGESQGIERSSDTTEIPTFTEDLESLKDTKSDLISLSDDAVVGANQLDQSGGSNNTNDIKNVEDPAKAVEHIESESKNSTKNGKESDKVTIIDEIKPPATEAPRD